MKDLNKIGGTSAIEECFMAFGLHNLSRLPGRLKILAAWRLSMGELVEKGRERI